MWAIPSLYLVVRVVCYNTDDVAVIDEIQMLRDQERGGAWTRVLLGLCAREIHLCGEEAAVNLVQRIVHTTGDSLEVTHIESTMQR